MITTRYFLSLLFSVISAAAFNVYGQSTLYEDHFDSAEKWYLDSYGSVKQEIKKGKLILASKSELTSDICPNKINPKDERDPFVINTRHFSGEITAQWVKDIGTTTNTGFGIEYLPFKMEIKPDGSYKIMTKELLKEWQVNYSSNGKPHPAIKTGQGENKLKLVLNDNVISFYINDQLIKKVNEAYPPNLQHFTTKKYCFKPFINGFQEVMFDDYIIKSVPVFDDLVTESKNTGNDDLSNLFKTPAQQLTQDFTQYGITMKVNPKWTNNNKNVSGSMISLIGDDFKNLESTFPEFAQIPSSFSITLALNPGTVDDKLKNYGSLVSKEFNTYLVADNKTLTVEDWKNKWVKQVFDAVDFTTAAGKKGAIYSFVYPSADEFDKAHSDVSVTINYLTVFMIPQPDNKIIQCSVILKTFSTKKLNKPLPEDITQFSAFGSEAEKQYFDLLKAMFKTITAPR